MAAKASLPPVRRRLLPLLVLGLLAGCGGSAEDDYADDVREVDRQVVSLNRDVLAAGRGARGQTNTQIEKRFGQLAQRSGETQQDLDDLDPPEDLKDEQEALVEALGNTQNSLEGIERAANTNNRRRAGQAAIQLNSSLGQLRNARRALAQATRD
jgi:hypothetical protein